MCTSSSSSSKESYALTTAQKSHFLEHGYIKLTSCFSREQAEEFTKDLWTRIGFDENDKKTWGRERTNMASLNFVDVRGFAPRAWGGVLGLLAPEGNGVEVQDEDENLGGGSDRGEGEGVNGNDEIVGDEEREWDGKEGWKKEVEDMIDDEKKVWGDGFIVNLGKEGWEREVVGGEESGEERGERLRGLDGWHVDGDFFVHYLDSPEQALLVIPLWSDIEPQGGGTAIATDSIKYIAQHLYDHPEGVTPWFNHPSNPTETLAWFQNLAWDKDKIRSESIIEATGKVGDVYLLHPFMLHSASRNLRRDRRVITNPPVSLKAPFGYGRTGFKNGEGNGGMNGDAGRSGKLSLVERKTLREVGLEEKGLGDWKIEGERKGWVSERMKRYEEAKRVERERLEREKASK